MSSAHHHHHHGNHDHYIHHQERKQHLFAVVVFINTVFILMETMAGLYADSNALLADAGHNASDVMSVLLAWLAVYLSSKRPTNRFTYGLKSSSILVSLFNSLLLWAACGAIAWHSVERLLHPAPTQGLLVLAVSTAGILLTTHRPKGRRFLLQDANVLAQQCFSPRSHRGRARCRRHRTAIVLFQDLLVL